MSKEYPKEKWVEDTLQSIHLPPMRCGTCKHCEIGVYFDLEDCYCDQTCNLIVNSFMNVCDEWEAK